MPKAVILFNLGGPQKIDDVQPFLYNLFSDPAIFSLPQPFRSLLAWVVSKTRCPKTTEIYQYLGGGSPIVIHTQQQALALEQQLGLDYRVFSVMRYWSPRAMEVIEEIKRYNPDRYYLLPLYPQYSTSTTASSITEFLSYSKVKLPDVPYYTFCCYPTQPNWIRSQVKLIHSAIKNETRPYRLLFSAHGLPERTIAKGDPYQFQVEQTVAAIMKSFPDQDYVICYQSRVGPLKWIGPSTESEIIRASHDSKGVVLIPVSFVSEHSETLYELDHLYGQLAITQAIPFYCRIPAVSVHTYFIQALVDLIKQAETQAPGLITPKICPPECVQGLCHIGLQ